MKFKRGDLVRYKHYWDETKFGIHYVQDARKVDSTYAHLPFVTYFGQIVEVIVINGSCYSPNEFTLVSSILREE